MKRSINHPLAALLLAALTYLSLTGVIRAATPAKLSVFFEAHCIECHDADSKKGGLDLKELEFKNDPATHARWVQIYDRVASGEMPPAKRTRPSSNEVKEFLVNLGGDLTAQHRTFKSTVMRRLNRTEFQNTLDDVLGIRLNLIDLLPPDTLSRGFDNQAEALGISDVQLRRYMEAADYALEIAATHEVRPETKTVRYTYADPMFERFLTPGDGGGKWLKRPDGAVVFFTRGYPNTTLRPFSAPCDGLYKIRINGYAYQTPKQVVFALQVGDSTGLFLSKTGIAMEGYYQLPPDTSATVSTEHWFLRGESLRIAPEGLGPKPGTPGLYNLKGGVAAYQGSGLAIQYVEIEGPILEEWPRRGHALLFGDLPLVNNADIAKPSAKGKKSKIVKPTMHVVSADSSADARRLLPIFVERAFRRPVSAEKVAPYVALFDAEIKSGASFEEAMRTAAAAVFCSPDFLYLVEQPRRFDDYALASRLSYFLWRTAPDAELLRLAAAGKLGQPETLHAQTERLLNDPKARRFVADFTDGWLDLRNIDFTTPDKQLYPEYDETLHDSFVPETRAFFAEMLAHNLPVSNIIASDFAMLNARLAKHYGIEGVEHLDIRKVPLPPDSKRGGILTQASILKVSANGTNTSPVIRGVWAMDRILGFKPPPPPPGVPGLEPDIRGATTIRETLAKHRTLESCNACHRVIDPPGFALEEYDVIGIWRDHYRSVGAGTAVKREVNGRKIEYKIGKPVDASGELAPGETFNGFAEFQKLLLGKQDRVTACLAERLLMFAAGREMGFSDRPEIARIVAELSEKKGGLRDLLHRVIQSDVFLNR